MLMRFISLEKPPYGFLNFNFWDAGVAGNPGSPVRPLLELFLATVKISFHVC
jgi:hypothetical protein